MFQDIKSPVLYAGEKVGFQGAVNLDFVCLVPDFDEKILYQVFRCLHVFEYMVCKSAQARIIICKYKIKDDLVLLL